MVATWASHLSAARILKRVLEELGARGIAALPVKGILTAHMLYEDTAERPIVDIDLRVSRTDFAGVVRLGQDRGWAPRLDSPHLGEVVFTVDGWEVDVESTVSDPGLCRIPVATMIARATRRVQPFGFEHLEPELHDHALILVLNAFKDGLGAPSWAIEDLLRVTRHDAFVVDRLVSRARQGGVRGATWIVSDWLARDHGSDGWRRVRDHPDLSPPSLRIRGPYDLLRRWNWPKRVGALLTASSNDSGIEAALGLTLMLGGIMKGRLHRRQR